MKETCRDEMVGVIFEFYEMVVAAIRRMISPLLVEEPYHRRARSIGGDVRPPSFGGSRWRTC